MIDGTDRTPLTRDPFDRPVPEAVPDLPAGIPPGHACAHYGMSEHAA
ncbi:hypothetical protein [Streptomyces sp. A0642]|nr:hypothetical protein [Streptomyces sp. A0642]